jgi:hypothetical protein
VTALGLLLLLQAIGLLVVGLFQYRAVRLSNAAQVLELPPGELLVAITHHSILGVLFIPLSLPVLIAAIGFLRVWSSAWLNAMLVQGLSLAVAIGLYVGPKPPYVYAVMLYSIFMVAYMHYYDVRVTFHTQSVTEE